MRVRQSLLSYWPFAILFPLTVAFFAYTAYSTLTVKCEQWDLYYPDLPLSLDGISICQLSDLHLKSLHVSPQVITRIIQSRDPDVIVLTGDLISSPADLDKIENYLSCLDAVNGLFFVRGNNEYRHLRSRALSNSFNQQMEESGWTLLKNEALYIKNLSLWIIGIDDPYTVRDDVDKAYEIVMNSTVDDRGFRLVIAHSSDCFDDVLAYGADLVLTGHTHGGQIRLPGLRPMMTKTHLGRAGIYEGYHVIENTPLYINRGLGESLIPFRFYALPEVAFFTLHRGNEQPKHMTTLK